MYWRKHNPLGGRGQSFGVIQPDGAALVEDRQIVVGVAGQADYLTDRQQGAPTDVFDIVPGARIGVMAFVVLREP